MPEEWPIYVHEAVRPMLAPADRLHPHRANPHNGDPDAVKDSLIMNGLYRPIYATRDGTIIAGHTLYAALLDLGMEQVPVQWIDSDPSAAVKVLLADNRVAELGQDDEAALLVLLRALDADDDLLGTGFTALDVADLERRLDRLAETPLDPEPGHRVKVLLLFTAEQHRAWTRIEERITATGRSLESGIIDLLQTSSEAW